MSTNLKLAPAGQKPQFLTVPEVAELLRKEPRTIYNMVSKGTIPYHKPKGTNTLLFDYDELMNWIKGK